MMLVCSADVIYVLVTMSVPMLLLEIILKCSYYSAYEVYTDQIDACVFW